MIIGAAGSLGNVLTKNLCKNNKIVAVDISENNLAYLYRLYSVSVYLQDFQNTEEIIKIINKENIDTIINCSALKHVSTCEKHIEQAINVNVIANLRIMDYLETCNKRFIYISSDKAIKPSNVYALTKQFTDYIIGQKKFKLVRGVNFLNSSGSVLAIWEQQRKNNKLFTLVREPCKRYFITLEQMAELVNFALLDNSSKIEYYPKKVYDIFINDLFDAFLLLHNLDKNNINIKPVIITPCEKLIEDLGFSPEIKELKNITDILELLKNI